MKPTSVVVFIACALPFLWLAWRKTEPAAVGTEQPISNLQESTAATLEEGAEHRTRTPALVPNSSDPIATSPQESRVPPDPAEPDKAEVFAHEARTPPGMLEGIVLVGKRPITTGGIAFYQRVYYERLPVQPQLADPSLGVQRVSI